MSRPTDTERGARMAAAMAFDVLSQRDMFPTQESEDLRDEWSGIYLAASETIHEEAACREAVRAC